MVRTRDYFLCLLTIAFLVIGIGATVADSYRAQGVFDVSEPLKFLDSEAIDRTATTPSTEMENRSERLASLRQKIAAAGLVSVSAPASTPVPTTDAPMTEEGGAQELLLCPQFAPYAGQWPTGVIFEEQEGARVAYVMSTAAATTSASTTTLSPTRTVLAQLPLRSVSQQAQNCIATDVIGLTKNGALISNNSAFAFAGWGEDTLIGYALDGYPIYGVSQAPTDRCGGRVVDGQYRYQLAVERSTFIQCFSGTPVRLP